MVITETPVFTRLITELMSDDEYRLLQPALVKQPDIGVIISGTGGLRKVRWKLEGSGKSGGVRVIYYWKTQSDQLYMLYGYRKSQKENLTAAQKNLLKQIVEKWINE